MARERGGHVFAMDERYVARSVNVTCFGIHFDHSRVKILYRQRHHDSTGGSPQFPDGFRDPARQEHMHAAVGSCNCRLERDRADSPIDSGQIRSMWPGEHESRVMEPNVF